MIEIPGYKVLRLLGQGGMATVYLALQQSLGREVALKVLSPALAQDPVATERFLREARVSAKLHHPNIVAIFDVGLHDGIPYMSIAYEPGGTVAQKTLARDDPKVALGIIRDIANALDYAHSKGVVHRDIKPENILLRNDGTCVLSDFGIAHAIEAKTSLTREGTSVGTPHYMSPEQLRGEPVDGRTDLYSLGVVLFQLLTGDLPYHGTDGWAIGIQHITAPVPRLPAHLEHLQTYLDALLAKDPRRRPQTGAEVVKWVDARLSGRMASLTVPVSKLGSPATGAPVIAASIAILPFADMSQGKDQEYLADGLSEELLNLLSKVPGLHVAGRSSAFSFKGKNAKLVDIGRELKVATVLEGSVRKFGERVRISVQLINVADGFQMWSETYDRQLTDVFAVQDEIAALVMVALKSELLPKQAPLDPDHAVAVEKAAAEARQREAAEKADAEARQREATEKAAAEARQREAAEKAAAEARQREAAEKAAAEARQREAAEKAAAEARQREAVERAVLRSRERQVAAQAAAAARQREAEEKTAAEVRQRELAEKSAADARQRKADEKTLADARQREQAERTAIATAERKAAEVRRREAAEKAAAQQRESADKSAAEARRREAAEKTAAQALQRRLDETEPGTRPPAERVVFTPLRGGLAAIVVLGLAAWLLTDQFSGRRQAQCATLLAQAHSAIDAGEFDQAAAKAVAAGASCEGARVTDLRALNTLIQNGRTKTQSDAQARVDQAPKRNDDSVTAQDMRDDLSAQRSQALENEAEKQPASVAETATQPAQPGGAPPPLRTQPGLDVRQPAAAATTPRVTATAPAPPRIDKALTPSHTQPKLDLSQAAGPAAQLQTGPTTQQTTQALVATNVPEVVPQPLAPPSRAEPLKRELVPISTPEPNYPAKAKRGWVMGSVTASFTVNSDGSVSNVQILSAYPYGVFDTTVTSAVGGWKFQPIDEPRTTTRTFTFKP